MEILLHTALFQAQSFRDLCHPGFLHLLSSIEQLVDETLLLTKHGSLGSWAGLHHGLQALSHVMLLHGDLRGLSFVFCSRLRQQQVARAKQLLTQALKEELLACPQGNHITRLRLQLCLVLTGALSVGDTSAEEELAAAVLTRLIALCHGCRYPRRTAMRALQLLQECCELARPGGAGGCDGSSSGAGNGQSSREPSGPAAQQHGQQQQQAQQASLAARLAQQLPGIRSALSRLLRHGYVIKAFHLQLLSDFISQQQEQEQQQQVAGAAASTAAAAEQNRAQAACSPAAQPAAAAAGSPGGGPSGIEEAQGAAESGQQRSAKRAKPSPPASFQPGSHPTAGELPHPVGSGATTLGRSRGTARHSAQEAAESKEAVSGPLTVAAGHSASPDAMAGKGEPGSGVDDSWRQRVAAAREVLGLHHFRDLQRSLSSPDRLQRYAALLLMAELFRGHIGPAEAAGGDATWQVTQIAARAAAAAGLQPLLLGILEGQEEGGSGDSGDGGDGGAESKGAVAEAALGNAADLQQYKGCSSWVERSALQALAADAVAHLALAERPLAGAAAAAAGTAGTGAAAAAPVTAGTAAGVAAHSGTQAAIHGRLISSANPGASSASAQLCQQAVLERGMQLLAAPDYTSRRLGCNVVSLIAQSLAHMVSGPSDAAWSASSREDSGAAAAGGSVPSVSASGEARPVQAAAQLYRSLAGLDQALAAVLDVTGIRCRLSALGAVYRIAALAPEALVLCSSRVPPLLADPHPDSESLLVPQVAAATLARLSDSSAIRHQLQQAGVPQRVVQLMVNMACGLSSTGSGSSGSGSGRSAGPNSSSSRSSNSGNSPGALWAASEGVQVLGRLVRPAASPGGLGTAPAADGRLTGASGGATTGSSSGSGQLQVQGSPDDVMSSLRKLVHRLQGVEERQPVVELLRQLQGRDLDGLQMV